MRARVVLAGARMARTPQRGRTRRRRARRGTQPIPLGAVDLLAGLAPGVELGADPLPPGIADATARTPATVTVDDVGRLLRSDESTVRRLIRTRVLRPRTDTMRTVVPPARRPPDKPGE
jgi:hypothetical protein